MIYMVQVIVGDKFRDEYVTANSAEKAIEEVRKTASSFANAVGHRLWYD